VIPDGGTGSPHERYCIIAGAEAAIVAAGPSRRVEKLGKDR